VRSDAPLLDSTQSALGAIVDDHKYLRKVMVSMVYAEFADLHGRQCQFGISFWLIIDLIDSISLKLGDMLTRNPLRYSPFGTVCRMVRILPTFNLYKQIGQLADIRGNCVPIFVCVV
jgi:hypothetical protein